MEDFLQRNRIHMQMQISQAKNWPRTPDRVHRVDPARIYPGWLLGTLQRCDSILWGRWDWHTAAWARMKLPDAPIPRIEFTGHANTPALKMLHHALNSIPTHGEWQTWGSWQYLDYFFDWLLYSFGYTDQLPTEPEQGAYHRLYQVFCLEAMLAWPSDYFGEIMAENRHGRSQGFYPTPHDVVEMMVRMNFAGQPAIKDDRDPRTYSVCDPAVGTGRMLLHASNYAVCLHGQDINQTCVKATIVNGFLYAPWLARPFSWIKPPPPPPEPPKDYTKPNWTRTRRGNLQGEFALV